MLRKLAACAVLALVLTASARATADTGAAGLQYYVGTWACTAGPPGATPSAARVVYTLDSGVLRQWGVVEHMGNMKSTYAFSSATSYDRKQMRYVSTFLDNMGGWELSTAKPWTGSVEHWVDISTDSGKLGHTDVTRTSHDAFSGISYSAKTGGSPNFNVACKRST
jgi:hypothetical protein